MASKKVAVVAVNPVNGMGLFQYLEAFHENGIHFTLFAVAPSREIRTNSGVALTADGVIADLRQHVSEYDALVFACGDAMPHFAEHASEPWNVDLMEVIAAFGRENKWLIGHCVAGLMFDAARVADGKRLAAHPMVLAAITHAQPSAAEIEIDRNCLTAREEHALPALIGHVVEVLKG